MASVELKPLTFEEAIEFFKDKVALTPEEFAALAEEVRVRAFTVSGIAALDVLNDILNALNRAIAEGLTMKEFQQSVNEVLAKRGWDGLTPYRADNIFRTNIQTAYQVGRYKQMTDPAVASERPYWMYDAVNDRRTRPSHMAMDGVVRRYDDPFWDTWYPPNGFRCRCSVRSLSQRQVDKRKITVETGLPPAVREVPNGPAVQILPDPHFRTNPAKEAWQPDLAKYPPKLRQAWEERQKQRRE